MVTRAAGARAFGAPLRLDHGFSLTYDVRARRLPCDRIRVTWATRVAIRDATFVVGGRARRGGRALALNAARGTRHRRRFVLTLPDARGVRFVTLYTFVGFSQHRIVVRVR
jgi:hypothetical protein